MKQVTTTIVATILLTLITGISTVVEAQTTSKSKRTIGTSDRKAFESLVREYIINNPEVIQEAMVALQKKEEKRRRDSVAENMVRSKELLYSDAFSPVGGDPNGDVSIVVFYDYFCGYCKKMLPALQNLVAADPSVKVIYKEFPIMGEQSVFAARAALAAARQGKFESFHAEMLISPTANDDVIKAISAKIGLDYQRLTRDMNDGAIAAAIQRNANLAASLSIEGTPAYLIGDEFIPGAIPADALAKIVAAQREKLTLSGKVAVRP